MAFMRLLYRFSIASILLCNNQPQKLTGIQKVTFISAIGQLDTSSSLKWRAHSCVHRQLVGQREPGWSGNTWNTLAPLHMVFHLLEDYPSLVLTARQSTGSEEGQKAIWNLSLELKLHNFCHILVAKAGNKSSTSSKVRKETVSYFCMAKNMKRTCPSSFILSYSSAVFRIVETV